MVRTSRAAKVAWMVAWLIVFYLVARVVSAHAGEVPPGPAAADLALLQLERVPLGSIVSPMADSNTVQVRDKILIVGAPFQLPYSLSVGSVSARWAPNTAYRTMPLAEFFQADATIDASNSGGPMFNLKGEVIGIVSHNIATDARSNRQGFVVTSNTAKQLLLEKRSAWSGIAKGSCSTPSVRSC